MAYSCKMAAFSCSRSIVVLFSFFCLELFLECGKNLQCLAMCQNSQPRIACDVAELQVYCRLPGMFEGKLSFSDPAWVAGCEMLHRGMRAQQLICRHAAWSAGRTIHPEPELVQVRKKASHVIGDTHLSVSSTAPADLRLQGTHGRG